MSRDSTRRRFGCALSSERSPTALRSIPKSAQGSSMESKSHGATYTRSKWAWAAHPSVNIISMVLGVVVGAYFFAAARQYRDLHYFVSPVRTAAGAPGAGHKSPRTAQQHRDKVRRHRCSNRSLERRHTFDSSRKCAYGDPTADATCGPNTRGDDQIPYAPSRRPNCS